MSQANAPTRAETACDDAELVIAAARGDRAAMAQVFDRYAGMVHAIALRISASARDAEDLVHDVFLEAWRDAALYDPARGSVRAWLAVRARSRALDRLGRAEARRRVALDDSAGTLLEQSAPSVAHPADALALRTALRAISDDVRVVLEETYFFGRTATEIAAALGIPVGTVKSRLARGLTLLRRSLGDEGENDDPR